MSDTIAMDDLSYKDLRKQGIFYRDQFQRFGRLDDIEKAIEYGTRVMELTPNGHPELSTRHDDLGIYYEGRFRRLGNLKDMEESIEHSIRAVELTANDDPDLARLLGNLGISYGTRYKRLGALDDLEKSIDHKSQALALTPADHPDLPLRHAALGVSYEDRYRRLGALDDLEKSIDHFSQALALTPADHPDLPVRYENLGVSYTDRYRRLGAVDNLNKSIEYHSRALLLTPHGHPDLSLRHLHRATSHHLLYQHTNDPSHLDISLASFRKASQLIAGPPRDVFNNALDWANLSFRHSHLNCIEAFRATIDLLPHFIWLGATTAQRYQDLSLVESVAVRAASAAIQTFEYSLALEWLEHTRCVVWNQTLTLRSPLDELASSHSALAARLQTTSEQLHHASSGSSSSNSATHTPEYRHRLAREYTTLLAEARSLPGFEDFLRPKKANALIQAARNGPIAVINCHEERCDALLVLPGQASVTHLALTSFTEKKARHARSEIEALLKHKKLRERGVKIKGEVPKPDPDVGPVLADLWNDVVKPVLECSGYLNNDPAKDLPHITWCPTGAMTFLPLHAAGDYTQTRSRVFDHVISSYTPTLTALLASTPTQLNRAPKVLAIGLPAAPSCLPLPGVVKELEDIKARTQGRAGYLELTDNQATAAAVLDAMEKSDWVHMACHAHQNVTDPTKSGFFLHGGTLDLATITQRSFRNKGLAFLSACQTAKGDEKLPDEAIHLASGMLMAGYSSVIGTMWSVVDEDAPFVADRVYEQLMKDGKIGNGEAGRALHEAVGGLREKVGEKEYARWVPYIHIGS